MKFKDFFEHLLLKESPDNTTTPYGNTVTYEDAEKSFFFSKHFYIYSNTPGIVHNRMIKLLQTYCDKTNNYNYPEETVMISKSGNEIVVKGNVVMFENIFREKEQINRNDLMQASYEKNATLFVGRIWESENIISFWNGIKDFKKSKNKLLESFLDMIVDDDLEDYIFEYQDYSETVQQDIDVLRNPGKDSNDVKVNDKQPDFSALPMHMIPPELKGQYMKMKGIKPKYKTFDMDREGD